MKKTLHAQVLIRTCYFGEYSEKLALKFEDAEDAELAKAELNKLDTDCHFTDPCGNGCNSKGWLTSEGDPKVILTWIAGDALDNAKKRMGYKKNKGDHFSLDYEHGKAEFEIEYADPNQLELIS